MSLDALRSALALERPDPSWGRTHKAVLECLGDHANAAGEAFVCVATICDEKWIDRKAVLRAIGDLREAGWIVDTGKRRGRTGQVIVWELPWIEHRSKQSRNGDTYAEPEVQARVEHPQGQQPQGLQDDEKALETTENAKGPQTGTLSERVPICPAKGPHLSGKESPKRDTEPSTRFNPPPERNPLAEGWGRAGARPPAPAPAREDRAARTTDGGGAKPEPKPKPKRGKRLVPEDWQPPKQLRAELAERWPFVALDDQLERFRDHSRANDKRFKDFDAAFRNWIRKAAEFAERDGKAPRAGKAAGSRKVLN